MYKRQVQNRCEDLLWKSPLELCSNHFKENQFLHHDKKSLRNPKTDGNRHGIVSKPTAIWLKIMTVQCTWYEERLSVDLCTSFCWFLFKFAVNVMWLWEFASLNTFCRHWRFDFVHRKFCIYFVSYVFSEKLCFATKPVDIFLVLCSMCCTQNGKLQVLDLGQNKQ